MVSPTPGALRFDGYHVQGAGALAGREGAEGVQVVGQAGERELDLVVAAEGGADLVQHAVAARDDDGAGVDEHVGADRSGISEQRNAGDVAGGEIVD